MVFQIQARTSSRPCMVPEACSTYVTSGEYCSTQGSQSRVRAARSTVASNFSNAVASSSRVNVLLVTPELEHVLPIFVEGRSYRQAREGPARARLRAHRRRWLRGATAGSELRRTRRHRRWPPTVPELPGHRIADDLHHPRQGQLRRGVERRRACRRPDPVIAL